jgi:predicted PolB exonuclease-like 3'-5' exonuclease
MRQLRRVCRERLADELSLGHAESAGFQSPTEADSEEESSMSEPIKSIKSEVWFFDIETVPCIESIRRVHNLHPGPYGDPEVLDCAYNDAGATEENPSPMLKTILQRVVAISFLRRRETPTGVQLSLHSLPTDENFDEPTIIETFLTELGNRRPQIVGYNHAGFDIPVLFQRAIILGIDAGKFCVRPNKPWDDAPDYFSTANDYNVDLMKVIGGWGKATPSLAEIAKACGIPAKISVSGSDVSDMWSAGNWSEIVDYCELDVLTTYLLWLRTARTCGLMSGQPSMFPEEEFLRQMLIDNRDDKPHLGEFLDLWNANKVLEVAA